MLEPIKRWLRGDYNSIRHRFWVLPREWLIYLLGFRLRGEQWVDYYAARLDQSQRIAGNRALKEIYKEEGKMHLAFLRKHGLHPNNTLLDYGCGVLRSGIFFVRYLAPGNYTGVDISKERLERGTKLMSEEGIDGGAYSVLRVRDCRLRELDGMTFDYVFANSVLTHMPSEDILTMLEAMRNLLGRRGQFYFTFAEAEHRRRRNIKDFWYSRQEVRAFCEQAGYRFRMLDDWPKTGDVMAMASIEHE